MDLIIASSLSHSTNLQFLLLYTKEEFLRNRQNLSNYRFCWFSCLVKFTLIWSQCNCLFSLFLSLLLLLLFFFLSLLLRLCSLNLIPESCRVLDFVLIDVHCLFCLCSFSFFFFFGFCGNSCFCWDCVIIWLISEFFLS